MEPTDYDEIQLCKILYSVRYGTTGGIKQIGTHNRSEIGSDGRAVLCAHPTMPILIMILIPVVW
jgi:hypothetical protein